MAMIITHGANTWRVSEGGESYLVSRARGSDANDQPKGWVWTVRAWRETRSGAHWHKLPAYGPKAAKVAAIIDRMLGEVR